MKKILLALFLFVSASTTAQAHVTHQWVLPMIIGGVIGYELNRPQYYPNQPVVVYPVGPSNLYYCIHPLKPIINYVLIPDPHYSGRYIQVEQFLGCTR